MSSSFSAGIAKAVKAVVEQLENGGPEGLSQHLQESVEALHNEVVLGLRRL